MNGLGNASLRAPCASAAAARYNTRMDFQTTEALRKLNNDFYRTHHESFSRSRGSAWPGWERVARHLEAGRLLDVACGNLRFERFLVERVGAGVFDFTCIDSCPSLAQAREGVSFIECDVLERLAAGAPLPTGFDSAVSFGFMHHVPSKGLRTELVRQLVESVRPGGVVALSFWQFMRDERLAAKARETTMQGCASLGLELEDGDCLLGWNGVEGAYRYCHSFTDGEVDELLDAVFAEADAIDRFAADGRTGALNGYAVLRRR